MTLPNNRSLVFHSPWTLSLEDKPQSAELALDEVLVRVHATGICGTDIGIVRGDYHAKPGVTIGHESAGEVVAIGAQVSAVRCGDRVVIDPTYHCGHCLMCRTQRPNHCETKSQREAGVSLDGSFSHFYRSNQGFVHPIAKHLSYAEASLTEPLSCVLTGLDQLRLRADMSTLIVGAGPMGMLYCYALAARGFMGQIMETSPGRLAICRDILPRGWQAIEALDTPVPALDLVIDTSGQATGWALRALRRGGQLLLVSLSSAPCQLQPAELTDKSLSIIGSIDSIGTFSLAKHLLETGVIPAENLITHHLPLSDYAEGFALVGLDLQQRRRSLNDIRALKVVLSP